MEKHVKQTTGENLTAYCGLYCGDCIRYQSRASDMARNIVNELKETNFAEYAKVKKLQMPQMQGYETMINVLKAISEIKCETPCRLGGDGCGGSCPVIQCITKKSLKGCWECDGFEKCSKLDFLKPFHGDAPLKNLRIIRQEGFESWAKHRNKCYPWL